MFACIIWSYYSAFFHPQELKIANICSGEPSAIQILTFQHFHRYFFLFESYETTFNCNDPIQKFISQSRRIHWNDE